jgi:hypothetical protein
MLEFDFKYDGLGFASLAFNSISGMGRSGTGVLKVDANVVATQKVEHTIPLILQFDETFDVGADTGTPVDDNDYQVPFRLTGKLNKLTITIEEPKLTPADEKKSLRSMPGKGSFLCLSQTGLSTRTAGIASTKVVPTALGRLRAGEPGPGR